MSEQSWSRWIPINNQWRHMILNNWEKQDRAESPEEAQLFTAGCIHLNMSLANKFSPPVGQGVNACNWLMKHSGTELCFEKHQACCKDYHASYSFYMNFRPHHFILYSIMSEYTHNVHTISPAHIVYPCEDICTHSIELTICLIFLRFY